ncbi:MAG TPA: PIN domain-containing protein [Microbacterium sp.]|uniref:PIN domain-containing protein n=1 Tax=Microbacterium sp. TaxID=51671 RepID=UPI002B49AADF|nr:PIN domain-containing protein [Microbacterium sp.]HKT57847.1 PIN domain-containing protein [Microbacterium sp.]
MIVLDGRVLIAHLERTHPLHDVVSPFIERERDDAFAITAVTATSVLVHPVLAGVGATVAAAFDRLELTIMPVTGADALGIAELRAAVRLPLVDALDIYAAQRYGARLATADRRLAQAAAARGVPTHLF